MAEASRLIQVMAASAEEAIPDGLSGRWWVAHTKPRQEKMLALHLWSVGVWPYLPLGVRITRSRRTGRTSTSMIPIFPGYLFFSATQHGRELALKTQRVVTILHVHDQGQMVNELRQVHSVLSSGRSYQTHRSINAGQAVRILQGPLTGLEGVVIGCRSRIRLVLNVHMLGQSVSVETTIDDVEAIDASPQLGKRQTEAACLGKRSDCTK
ncbi:MAG: transcription termination/antitermination NusG family protein [Planctomycetota bacterium]